MQLRRRSFSLLAVFFTIVTCAQSQCNINEPYQECVALYRIFRNALYNTSNNENIFLLQSVYYPITRITPVLAKVKYNLSITNFCNVNDCPANPPYTSPCFKDGLFTFGWTSKEIFSVFHPGVINQLRFQLPFWILQIADDISYLTDDFDIKAYLWDGIEELPSINLTLVVNLSASNDSACKCHPPGQLIEQALGELNQWLNAFAKVAQTGTYQSASAEDKAITLSCAAVERFVVENLSPDARYGRAVLIYSYSIGFTFGIILGPVFVPLLFTMFEKVIRKEKLEKNSYNKLFVVGSSIVCFGYNFLSIVIAFHQVTRNADIAHEFDHLRTGFLFILFAWLFILSAVHTGTYDWINAQNADKRAIHNDDDDNDDNAQSKCFKKLMIFFCAFSLSTFTALLMLNFAPTVILLFAHPIDTSALIALHIALFYSTATVLAVFLDMLQKYNKNKVEKSWQKICFSRLILFFNIIIGVLLVPLLPFTYICIILVYQFVVARSGNYAVDSDNFASYIPSIAIAVFGYVLKKGAFDISREEKMRIRNSSLAENIWEKIPKNIEVTVKRSNETTT